MSDIAKHNTRTPGGHPEGYLEAFGNIYKWDYNDMNKVVIEIQEHSCNNEFAY